MEQLGEYLNQIDDIFLGGFSELAMLIPGLIVIDPSRDHKVETKSSSDLLPGMPIGLRLKCNISVLDESVDVDVDYYLNSKK